MKFKMAVEQGIGREVIPFAITSGGALVGKLIILREAAPAFLGALRAGHVGPDGSGADVEIVLEAPAVRPS